MRSRYDLAEDSTYRVSDGTFYPDIFTVPMKKFRFTESPREHFLTAKDIERPDIMMHKEYTMSELDDFLLWINDIGFMSDEATYKKIFMPSKVDLENFYYKNRV